MVVDEAEKAPPGVTWMSKLRGSVKEKVREHRYLKRVEGLVDVSRRAIYLLTASIASLVPLYLS